MYTIHHGGEGWVAGARDSLLVTIKKQKELMASLSPFSVNLGISMLCSKFRVFGVILHLNAPNQKTFLRDTPKVVFSR